MLLADRLGVSLRDVLYLDSKVSGTVDRPEVHPPLAREPSAVRAFVKGAHFQQRNAADYALWRAVDKHISAAFKARPKLHDDLKAFTALRARAVKACPEPRDGFSFKQCYWRDNGCVRPHAHRAASHIVNERGPACDRGRDGVDDDARRDAKDFEPDPVHCQHRHEVEAARKREIARLVRAVEA